MCAALQDRYDKPERDHKQLEFHDTSLQYFKTNHGVDITLPPPPMASIELPVENPTEEFFMVNHKESRSELVIVSDNLITGKTCLIRAGQTGYFRHFKDQGWAGGILPNSVRT